MVQPLDRTEEHHTCQFTIPSLVEGKRYGIAKSILLQIYQGRHFIIEETGYLVTGTM